MSFKDKLTLGNGIYTVSDMAKILRLPYAKVYRWLNEYWDGELGKAFESNYSWTVNNSRAVGFHTLVEFYVMMQFARAGVRTREVLNAHKMLSEDLDTHFPFAQKKVLENIRTDRRKIFLNENGRIITLDMTRQLNLSFIHLFCKNLEFDKELLAARFWPLGKNKNIVVDPKRQFGHPVVGNTNIYPETLYNLYKAGEPEKFLAFTYEISEQEVKDAIEYCMAA